MAATKNQAGMFEEALDDHVYEFSKWMAEPGLDTLLDIARIVGKPLGMAVGAFIRKGDGESGLDQAIPAELPSMIMEALTERMDKATCTLLIKKLSTDGVMCDGKKIVFNTHYSDRYGHLMKVVRANLEVQYGNFFGALLAVLPAKKGAVAEIKAGMGISNHVAAG